MPSTATKLKRRASLLLKKKKKDAPRLPISNGTATRLGQASGSTLPGAPGKYINSHPVRTDIAYVELTRQDGESFGLIIAGGSDHHEPVTIADLREGGIAKRTELLEIGDRILAVNGTSTDDITHDAVARLLQSAGTTVYLEIEYDLPDNAPPPEAATKKKCISVDVVSESDGFGFKLRGGVDEGLNRPLTIAYIRAGSDIHKRGTVKVGDRLMRINDKDVTEYTLSEAITALRQAQGSEGSVQLEIEYDVTIQAALQDNDPGSIILVELVKPPGVSLGLTLNGSSEPGEPITISDIRPGGIADRCGALHQFDRLLAIDGNNLERGTLPQAVAMLLKVEHIVRLEILPVHRSVKSPTVPDAAAIPSVAAVSSSEPEDADHLPAPPDEILHDGGRVTGLNGTHNGSGRNSPVVKGSWDRYQPPTVPTTTIGLPSSNGFGSRTPSSSRDDSALGTSDAASVQSFSRPRAHTTAGPPPAKPKPPVARRNSSLSSQSQERAETGSLSVVDRHVLPSHNAVQLCRQENTDLELVADPFGYGFSIAGGGLNGPITVSSIEKDSPADRVGVIQVGDRIITINSMALTGMNLDDVCKLIRESGGHMVLNLEFDVADGVKPTSGVFDVRLYKNTTSLGLTINGGEGDGMWISQVKNGGVAYRSGLVERGDGLLAINGVPVGTSTLSEAAGMLRDSTDIVVLQIRKKERQAELDDNVEFTVELMRRGRSLGITLNGSTLPGEPIYVSDIREDGVVHRTGALQKGDIIVSINNRSLRTCNLAQAVRLLEEVGDCVQLKIQRASKKSFGSDSDSQVSSLATASFPSPIRQNRDSWQAGRSAGTATSDEDAHSSGSTPSTYRNNVLSASRGSQIGSVGARTPAGVVASLSHMGTGGQSKPIIKRPTSAGQEGKRRWSEMPSAADTAITASLPTSTPGNMSTVRVPTRQQTSFSALPRSGSTSTTHTTDSLPRQSRPLSHALYSDTGSLSRSELSSNHLAPPSDNSSQSSPQTEAHHLQSVTDKSSQPAKDPASLLEELESSLLDSSTFTSLLSGSTASTANTITRSASASIASMPVSGTAAASMAAGGHPRRSSFRQAVPSSKPMSADRYSLDGGERGVTPTVQSVEMHVIELSRPALNISFGFSISDGLSEPGVYIRGLMPGGIAQQQSKLKPLDRVLQINSKDVRDLDCRRVLPILSNVRESLRMVVCRCSQPRSMSGLSSPTSFK